MSINATTIDSANALLSLLRQRRNFTADYDQFINEPRGDARQLLDMDRMVATLHQLHTTDARVVIVPDFDMDGIASGVLGYAGLAELGFTVSLHTPDYTRGHDFGVADVEEIAQLYPDTAAVLTCDGGVNAHTGIQAAKDHGWLTLVTDHHQELAPGSQADVTVNPCRLDESFPFQSMCGAFVLWQVLHTYTQTHQPHKLWSIHLLRVFAGIGTVSDVMPVLHQNRAVVRDAISIARLLYVAPPATAEMRYGAPITDPELIDIEQATLLQLLPAHEHHQIFRGAFLGLAEWLRGCQIAGKLRERDELDESFFGFSLAPAFNAPRRTGNALWPCFEVFLASSTAQRRAAVSTVLEVNEARRELVTHLLESMSQVDQPYAPWIYFSQGFTGMFGLLASRLMHEHGHPVMVMHPPSTAGESISGSARAPEWFNVLTDLVDVPGFSAIGHAHACGVSLARVEHLDKLTQAMAQITATATAQALLGPSQSRDTPADLVLGASPRCDARADDAEMMIELVRLLATMAPYGHGHQAPLIEVEFDPYRTRLTTMGSSAQHLKFSDNGRITALWWNAADEHETALRDRLARATENTTPLRVLGRLSTNTFREVTRVQLIVDTIIWPEEHPFDDQDGLSVQE